ncbi:MAG: gliding motility-associated ABC transporter permease subunit GldF, partial [Flavobacterium sp.]
MKALIYKELQIFFGSIMGYLVIIIFLILTGLNLWVFEGNFNIINSGFADLKPFFEFSPWIFMFLIPAITMKSFAEEIKQGTIELLLTKPLTY